MPSASGSTKGMNNSSFENKHGNDEENFDDGSSDDEENESEDDSDESSGEDDATTTGGITVVKQEFQENEEEIEEKSRIQDSDEPFLSLAGLQDSGDDEEDQENASDDDKSLAHLVKRNGKDKTKNIVDGERKMSLRKRKASNVPWAMMEDAVRQKKKSKSDQEPTVTEGLITLRPRRGRKRKDQRAALNGPEPVRLILGNFACPFQGCSYSSKVHTSVVHHIRTHTKEKPYHCPNCQRPFSRQYHVNRHIKKKVCQKEDTDTTLNISGNSENSEVHESNIINVSPVAGLQIVVSPTVIQGDHFDKMSRRCKSVVTQLRDSTDKFLQFRIKVRDDPTLTEDQRGELFRSLSAGLEATMNHLLLEQRSHSALVGTSGSSS